MNANTKPEVLAVIINWRRPQNLPLIVGALRAQTVPLHICVIECAPGTEFALPPDQLHSLADTVFTVNRNFGPMSRLIPALAFTEYEYVFFQVDDFAPGPRCVEHFLLTARHMHNQFATLGQDGRRVDMASKSLSGRRVRMHETECVPVDAVTSSELVRSDAIQYAIDFRWKMIRRHGIENVSLFEDDLFLCFGIQEATGLPSLLTPDCPSPAESWRATKFRTGEEALCARPDHREGRDLFVWQAIECGWRSLA